MPNHRPTRLPLRLQRRDPPLQLRDLALLRLDHHARDISPAGDALHPQRLFGADRFDGRDGFGGQLDVEGAEVVEDLGGEVRVFGGGSGAEAPGFCGSVGGEGRPVVENRLRRFGVVAGVVKTSSEVGGGQAISA